MTDNVHVHRLSFPGGSGSPRNPPPYQRVDQTRFPDIGAADEGDFGERRIGRDVGPGKGADEGGSRRLGQASFLCRARSVTGRGGRPWVTVSGVTATSRTSSRLGRSNMMSVIIS